MGEYYTQQPFGNPPSLDGELTHDPGNSSHWSVPHPAYTLTDPAVYQSAQLVYPESSQRTIVSTGAYPFYGGPVRATQHSVSLSALQLPREPYDQLGQGYYSPPYYPAFTSLTGSGAYESADNTARDEGMYSL